MILAKVRASGWSYPRFFSQPSMAMAPSVYYRVLALAVC